MGAVVIQYHRFIFINEAVIMPFDTVLIAFTFNAVISINSIWQYVPMFQLVRSQWDLLVIIVHQNVNPELHQQQLLQARQMDLCKLSAALVPVSS